MSNQNDDLSESDDDVDINNIPIYNRYIQSRINQNNKSASDTLNWYSTLPIYFNTSQYEKEYLIEMSHLHNYQMIYTAHIVRKVNINE